MPRQNLLVIIGSVRRQRIGPCIAAWVAEIARAEIPAMVEVIDLRNWPLPMDDEPGVPSHSGYEQPHTAAWSAKVAGADGFVFVTPQYNWGYPAALKNAVDHLYREWLGKPAAIVSYGSHGGGKSAAQFREVLTCLRMTIVETMPALTLPAGQVEANSGMIDPVDAFASDRGGIVMAMGRLAALLATTGSREGTA